ncbi:MAG: hypothetical protein CMH64_01630 [Nanoarchaeota archaeon]|nr:hypothetical protein [Nanoarchaeota archaeon]
MVIGKNTLKLYEYDNIEQYFNYIIESYLNGNLGQVRDLIKDLSNDQKKDFLMYLKYDNIKDYIPYLW